MPAFATSERKNGAVTRLPTRRPCTSGNATRTVSISPARTSASSPSSVMLPGTHALLPEDWPFSQASAHRVQGEDALHLGPEAHGGTVFCHLVNGPPTLPDCNAFVDPLLDPALVAPIAVTPGTS